jgi:hypothetical protein
MKPHPVVVNILRAMTSIIPTWKIVPTNDVIDTAYKTQEKRDEIRSNPYCYKGKPRLKTAYELLKVSLDLEANLLHQVSATCFFYLLLESSFTSFFFAK